MEQDLRRRIARLEARVRDLESLLGVQAEPVAPRPGPADLGSAALIERLETPSYALAEPPAPPPVWTDPTPAEPPQAPPVAPSETGRPAPSIPPVPAWVEHQKQSTDAPPVAPPIAPPIAPPVVAPRRPGPQHWDQPGILAPRQEPRDLETLIGGRWFMAAGALIIVIGAGLFLKLAYDRGWLGHLSPALKCLSGAAFGAALLGAGEVLRRRLGPKASVGASGAGLAVLYGSAFAAYGAYHLISDAAAFVLLAAIAALGFWIAGIANLASLAILALVGAYLNPLIIRTPNPSPYVMPAYLLTLQVVGLALSAWRASPFRPLRPLTWWGTVVLGSLWLLTPLARAVPAFSLLFLGAVWAAVHTELALAALASSRTPEARQEQALGLAIDRPITELRWNRVRFIATSFSSTAWCAVMGTAVAHGWVVPDWMVPAAFAAASAVLALTLAGNLRILRDVPTTDLERLGAALMMQAGALLIAAVALGIGGWMQAVAWLAMGTGAVAAGRWVRSRGLDIYGLAVLAIAVGRLITADSPVIAGRLWSTESGGLVVSNWTILMVAGSAAWWTAALLLLRLGEPGRGWRAIAHWCAAVAMALLAGSLLDPTADFLSIAAVWLGLAVVTQWIARRLGAAPLTGLAFALLGIATLRIVAGGAWRTVAPRPVTVYFTIAGLAVTRWLVLMGAAAAAWIGSAALVPPERPSTEPARPALRLATIPVIIGLLLLYAGMLQPGVPDATRILAWAGIGAVVLGVHSLRPRLALDIMGMAGLLAAGLAWTFDYSLSWMSSTAPALLHPGLWVCFAVSALLIGAGYWLRSPRNPAKPTWPEALPVPGIAGAVLLFIASSLEVARIAGILTADPMVRGAAVSIWWGLLAVALIALGFLRVRPWWRYVGLALLGAAALKAVILDLAEVSQLARIISFVALGLLMLGVAAGYTGLARLHARAPARP